MKRLLLLALLFALPASAQVALSGPNSAFNPIFPNVQYSLATVTGNGSATISLQAVSTLTIRITGTYSAATTQFLVSNDNTNFTPLSLASLQGLLGGSILTGAQAAVNGLYTANVAGMTQLKITNSGTFTGTSQIIRLLGSANSGLGSGFIPDPCQDKMAIKQSLPITGTAPNTVVAIPNTVGQTTYVCDINVVTGTAATSVTVSAGTGATCGTGNIALAGPIPIAVGQQLFGGWGGTVFGPPRIPQSNDVCVAVAGGTAAYGGWATFVKQ